MFCFMVNYSFYNDELGNSIVNYVVLDLRALDHYDMSQGVLGDLLILKPSPYHRDCCIKHMAIASGILSDLQHTGSDDKRVFGSGSILAAIFPSHTKIRSTEGVV